MKNSFCTLPKRMVGYKKDKKRRRILVALFLCGFCLLGQCAPSNVKAEDGAMQGFYDTVYGEIESLSQTELEALLGELTEEQIALFENKNWKEIIKDAASGESVFSYDGIVDFILSIFKNNALKYVSTVAGIVGVSVLTSILSSMKSGFMEEGVGNVIFFAGYAVILMITLASAMVVTKSASSAVDSIQKQMAVLLPVMLGFLTGAGGNVSGGAYASATAFLSNGILSVITSLIFPILKIMTVLAVLGNISEGLKLGELFSFFANVCKWLIITTLAVYSLVLGAQGITAGAHDGISYKLLKYTVGNSLPLVGGTVKDGLDMVMASFLVVKNAIGVFAIILLAGIAIGAILKLIVFSWSLKLASGILQPLGEERTCGFLSKIVSVLQYYIAVLAAACYLYAVTLFAVISAGAGVL